MSQSIAQVLEIIHIAKAIIIFEKNSLFLNNSIVVRDLSFYRGDKEIRVKADEHILFWRA